MKGGGGREKAPEGLLFLEFFGTFWGDAKKGITLKMSEKVKK